MTTKKILLRLVPGEVINVVDSSGQSASRLPAFRQLVVADHKVAQRVGDRRRHGRRRRPTRGWRQVSEIVDDGVQTP